LIVRVEPLGKQHDRAAFSSERPDIDDWFRRRAGQDEKRNVPLRPHRQFLPTSTAATALERA
jgi:hypothetical protein